MAIALNGGMGGASSTPAFGLLVMQVGFFVILVGGIMAVAQAVAQASEEDSSAQRRCVPVGGYKGAGARFIGGAFSSLSRALTKTVAFRA
jgi:hypothetical protein